MRHRIFILPAIAALFSCAQEIEREPIYELGSPERVLTARAEAGTVDFTIYANGTYTGTLNDSWMGIQGSDGTEFSGYGDGTLSISYTHNPGETRTGTATLTLGNREIELTIIQRGDQTRDEGIIAEHVASSSSTLTFSWGEGENTAEQYSHPYWFGLYRDSGLTELVVRHHSEGASSIWNKSRPAFTFGGLEKDTKYYFAVIDSTTMCRSETIEAMTTDFTNVQPEDAKAEPGAVILAEDFSEIPWNGDEVNGGAGYRSSDISEFHAPSGDMPEGGLGNKSFECLLFDTGTSGLGEAVSKSRLAGWGATGQASAPSNRKKIVLARAGYVKLGGYSYVSGLVTPQLSCIPEGKVAKVKVTFTASRYGTDSEYMLISVATGSMKDNLFTETSRQDRQFDVRTRAGWNQYTVELDEARFNSHIIISPDGTRASSGGGKLQHRLFIDDITIELISMEDDVNMATGISAETIATSSSTVTISWGEGSSSQYLYPYWFGLYRDAGLKEPVRTFNTEAGADIWGKAAPRFTFAGLDPGTTYYFAAYDYENRTRSEVLEVRTGEFTPVDPSEAVCAEGMTILAEDFSELAWYGDAVNAAAGANPDGTICSSSTEALLWKDGAMSGRRLERWSALCQAKDNYNAVLARPGYIKLGGYSYVTDIVSPEFSCIPQDRTAKVRVTFTARRYGSDSQNTIVSLVTGNSGDNRFTAESRVDSQLDINATAEWQTYTVELSGARPDTRLLIGPDAAKSGKGNGSSQHRMYLKDIKVEIIELQEYVEADIDAQCVETTSSTLKFTWDMPDSTDPWSHAYEFGLYRDRFHTDPVAVHHTEAGASVWSQKNPVFIFTGLEQGTEYYFVVHDADDMECRSLTIPAVTDDFETISPDKAQAKAGATILAEDFSQLLYNGDGRGTWPAAGINPDGTLCNSSKETLLFSEAIAGERVMSGWSAVCQSGDTRNAVLARPGYIKLGGYSYVVNLVSPALECIPEDMEARIKVSFSAVRYGSDNLNTMVSLVTGSSDANRFTAESRTDIQFDLSTQTEWNTYTFEIDGARHDSHVLIGPDAAKSGKGNGKSQQRMYIDNIKVEIVSMGAPSR
ncbi:MAG: BACON domain-containing protein [Clostridium sp.]|nr:BACON domain-containing protein [Bacteroides sp.]MCM1199133.1 BACON domain-containing protein [Clostridium sp.]